MKKIIPVLIIVLVLAAAAVVWQNYFKDKINPGSQPITSTNNEYTSEKGVIIRLTSPKSGGTIKSPVTITGEAPGTWYFEASFPITIVNWDGLIIGEGHADAQSDWMTESYVPFTATLTFSVPPFPAGKNNGSIILKKDNPSDLPEHDDSVEIPVKFD